jgi:hypothetical protein
MTNHCAEIDTTARKSSDQRHLFLGCFEMPPWEFFRDHLAASTVESEVFRIALV